MENTIKTIYFVRHGLCDTNNSIIGNELDLNEKGIKFSFNLPNLIDDEINFIACSEKSRCKNTVKNINCPNKKYYNKEDFQNMIPLEEVKNYNCSIICFCKEDIYFINKKLNLFDCKNSDESYKFIYKFEYNGEFTKDRSIETCFSK